MQHGMKNVKKFYEPVADDSYFIFELQSILGLCRSTVYKILNECQIRTYISYIGRRPRSKVKRKELLKMIHSKWFRKYFIKLKNTPSFNDVLFLETSFNSNNSKGASSRHISLLETPAQFARLTDKLTVQDVNNAILAGVIPIVIVGGVVYIEPKFFSKLLNNGGLIYEK